MSCPGKFVVIEGIDGCGKSTQASLLQEWLQQRGSRVQHFREPGGTALGEQIRALFLDPANDTVPKAELMLLFAARIQLLQKCIEPALRSGDTVICERFIASSYAYQSASGAGAAPEQQVASLQEFISPYNPPDLTFVLDLPVELAIERRTSNDKQDRFGAKGKAFMDKVRQCYLQQAEKDSNTYVIDATQPASQVQAELQRHLEEHA